MKCKSCNYDLWNLAARVCPECATPFKPSEFEFKPNSVKFCCPRCDQAYYGTDERGLLVPRSFACVSCQAPIDMDEMVLRPADGADGDGIEVGRVPWVAEKSRFVGLAKTVGYSMVSPTRIARAVTRSEGEKGGYTFALALDALGVVAIGVVQFAVFAFIGAFAAGPKAGIGPGAMFGAMAGFSVVGLVFWFALSALWTVCWAGISHLALRICGCRDYAFGKTLAVIGYSSGPSVLAWIPLLGSYVAVVGTVWRAVSAGIMIAALYPGRAKRAVVCVVLPPVLAVLTFVGLVIAALIGAFALMSSAGKPTGGPGTPPWFAPTPTPLPAMEAKKVMSALTLYRVDHSAWPQNAVELADGHYIVPGDLMLDSQKPLDDTLVLHGRRLTDFPLMTADDQKMMIELERAKFVDSGVGSYRLGDYVFCFDGVDPDASPGRWAFIQCNRNDVQLPDLVTVGLADGTILGVERDDWAAELEAENVARAAAGLRPIEDPFAPFMDTGPAVNPDGP